MKSLIDRLINKPEWQHPDPAVRAEAVLRLPSAEREVLLAIAREDTEPRVRRAAAKKLADIETLTYELIQQGVNSAAANEDSLHTKIVNRVERELIAQVMLSCNNVQTKAAARLGINRNTLHKKLKEHELETPHDS